MVYWWIEGRNVNMELEGKNSEGKEGIVDENLANDIIVNETFIHDAFIRAHRCSYCGGKFTGYLKKRCVRCGRYKNYK